MSTHSPPHPSPILPSPTPPSVMNSNSLLLPSNTLPSLNPPLHTLPLQDHHHHHEHDHDQTTHSSHTSHLQQHHTSQLINSTQEDLTSAHKQDLLPTMISSSHHSLDNAIHNVHNVNTSIVPSSSPSSMTSDMNTESNSNGTSSSTSSTSSSSSTYVFGLCNLSVLPTLLLHDIQTQYPAFCFHGDEIKEYLHLRSNPSLSANNSTKNTSGGPMVNTILNNKITSVVKNMAQFEYFLKKIFKFFPFDKLKMDRYTEDYILFVSFENLEEKLKFLDYLSLVGINTSNYDYMLPIELEIAEIAGSVPEKKRMPETIDLADLPLEMQKRLKKNEISVIESQLEEPTGFKVYPSQKQESGENGHVFVIDDHVVKCSINESDATVHPNHDGDLSRSTEDKLKSLKELLLRKRSEKVSLVDAKQKSVAKSQTKSPKPSSCEIEDGEIIATEDTESVVENDANSMESGLSRIQNHDSHPRVESFVTKNITSKFSPENPQLPHAMKSGDKQHKLVEKSKMLQSLKETLLQKRVKTTQKSEAELTSKSLEFSTGKGEEVELMTTMNVVQFEYVTNTSSNISVKRKLESPTNEQPSIETGTLEVGVSTSPHSLIVKVVEEQPLFSSAENDTQMPLHNDEVSVKSSSSVSKEAMMIARESCEVEDGEISFESINNVNNGDPKKRKLNGSDDDKVDFSSVGQSAHSLERPKDLQSLKELLLRKRNEKTPMNKTKQVSVPEPNVRHIELPLNELEDGEIIAIPEERVQIKNPTKKKPKKRKLASSKSNDNSATPITKVEEQPLGPEEKLKQLKSALLKIKSKSTAKVGTKITAKEMMKLASLAASNVEEGEVNEDEDDISVSTDGNTHTFHADEIDSFLNDTLLSIGKPQLINPSAEVETNPTLSIPSPITTVIPASIAESAPICPTEVKLRDEISVKFTFERDEQLDVYGLNQYEGETSHKAVDGNSVALIFWNEIYPADPTPSKAVSTPSKATPKGDTLNKLGQQQPKTIELQKSIEEMKLKIKALENRKKKLATKKNSTSNGHANVTTMTNDNKDANNEITSQLEKDVTQGNIMIPSSNSESAKSTIVSRETELRTLHQREQELKTVIEVQKLIAEIKRTENQFLSHSKKVTKARQLLSGLKEAEIEQSILVDDLKKEKSQLLLQLSKAELNRMEIMSELAATRLQISLAEKSWNAAEKYTSRIVTKSTE